MGLINYLGESKVIKKICELLNVKDVKVNGTSVVDASGDANITVTSNTFATGDAYGSLKIDGTDIPVRMRAIAVTTAGTDLNNYNSEGVYYFSSANAPSNSPLANSYGVLIVIVYTDSARKQIWLRHATAEPMSTYTYIRTYRSNAWGTWQKYALAETEDVENVKQLAVGTSSSQYRVLLTTTNTNTEETNTVRKCSSLLFQPSTGDLNFSRPHTGTGATAQRFIIGNDTPIATSGNNYSVLRMYGKGQYYGQFVDSQNGLNANRTYTLPDQNGCMAIRDNITRAKLDNNWNLLSLPYYGTGGTINGMTYVVNGNGSISCTGNATATASIVLRRYSEVWILPPGKYKLTGCPSGGSSSKYVIRVGTYSSGSTTWLGYDEGSGYEFTLTEEKQVVIQINIYSGYGDSLTFTPTLVRLNGGWVDLGTLTENTQSSISNTFSEFYIEVTLYTGGTPRRQTFHIFTSSLFLSQLEYHELIYDNDANYFNFWVITQLSGNNVLITPRKSVVVSAPLPTLSTEWKIYGKA